MDNRMEELKTKIEKLEIFSGYLNKWNSDQFYKEMVEFVSVLNQLVVLYVTHQQYFWTQGIEMEEVYLTDILTRVLNAMEIQDGVLLLDILTFELIQGLQVSKQI